MSSPARRSSRDDVEAIRAQVRAWVDDEGVDVIISTGGTGFAPRDVTPEAVKPLFRREMDGFSVLFHHASFGTVGLSTLQSRAFAGQIGDTFVFCLPGSTGACRDGWDLVLKSRARQPLQALLARRTGAAAQASFAHERTDARRRERPCAHGGCVGQGRHRRDAATAHGYADLQARDARAGPGRNGAQGIGRSHDRRAGRHHGRQAHRPT